jgi:hypothetical protein
METDIASELRRGVLPAADLRERLGVSPATLMRQVREAGPEILRIGRGRGDAIWLASGMAEPGQFTVSVIPN